MRVTGWHRMLWLAAGVLWAACSGDSGGGVEEHIPSTGRDLMRFVSLASGSEIEAPQTRASSPLTTGFLVSTYKWLGSEKQTVMPKYEARYQSPNTWNLYGSISDGFYQQQDERYWDLSANSYHFYAVAPATNPQGVTLTDTQLHLPADSQFEFHNETCTNGTLNNDGKETHYVAQIERQMINGQEAHDYDRLLTGENEINTTSSTPTRAVALPFHHLISKVRFGLYTSVPQLPDDTWKIKSVTVKAKNSSGNLITQANGYDVTLSSTNDNLLKGRFSTTYSSDSEVTLITTNQEMLLNQCTKQNPFYLQCENGMRQIPQGNITMEVTLVWSRAGGGDETITKVLTPPDGATTFTWEPNLFYTYYIVITETENIEIVLTASVTEWSTITIDINGSLEN